MVSQPKIDVKLESPKSINASKIANKKICGIRVLSSSQRSQVYKGSSEIDKAQYEVKNTTKDLNKASNKQGEACQEGTETEENKEDSEDQHEDDLSTDDIGAMTNENVTASSNLALEHSEMLEGMLEEFDELNDSITEENDADYEILEESGEELECLSSEIDELNAELERLTEGKDGSSAAPASAPTPAHAMAPAKAPAAPASDGMGGVVDEAFDGTGSGANSAYSLSTATETQEDQAKNPTAAAAPAPMLASAPAPLASAAPATPTAAPTTGSTNTTDASGDAARIEEISTEIEEKSTRATELSETTTASQEAIETRSTETSEHYTEQTEISQGIVDDGETANEATYGAREFFQDMQQIGDFTKQTGEIVEKVGQELQITGIVIDAVGDGTMKLGQGIGAIAKSLIGIGAPLVPAWGSGTGIVAGGSSAEVSSDTTTAGGIVLKGTAKTLHQVGSVTEKVGDVTKTAGQFTLAGAYAGTTACDIADGNWLGAITNGLIAVSNGLSGVQGLGDAIGKSAELCEKAAGTIEKIQSGIEMAQKGIAVGVAIDQGDWESLAVNATSLTGQCIGGKAGALMVDSASTYTATKATVNAIQDGDVLGAITNGTGAIQSGMKLTQDIDANFGTKIEKFTNKIMYKNGEKSETKDVDVIYENKDGSQNNSGKKCTVGSNNYTVFGSTLQTLSDAGAAVNTYNQVDNYIDSAKNLKNMNMFGGNKDDNTTATTSSSTEKTTSSRYSKVNAGDINVRDQYSKYKNITLRG